MKKTRHRPSFLPSLAVVSVHSTYMSICMQVSLPEPGRQVDLCRRSFDGSGQGAVQRRWDGASVDRLRHPGCRAAHGARPAATGLMSNGGTIAQSRFRFSAACRRTPAVQRRAESNGQRFARVVAKEQNIQKTNRDCMQQTSKELAWLSRPPQTKGALLSKF